jgi:hypothetical protein
MGEIIEGSASQAVSQSREGTHLTTEEQLRVQYYKVLGDLLAEAVSTRTLGHLASALAWSIARLIDGFGVLAAGDILAQIGRYIGELSERRSAQEEAEIVKKEGRRPS